MLYSILYEYDLCGFFVHKRKMRIDALYLCIYIYIYTYICRSVYPSAYKIVIPSGGPPAQNVGCGIQETGSWMMFNFAFCFPLQVVYVCSFVYSLGAPFVHSIARVFAPLFVRLFVLSFGRSSVRPSFVRALVRSCARSFDRSFDLSFVCWCVCSFVRFFIRSPVRSFVCPFFFFALFFHFLSLHIDVNIVRHSPKEVVDDIEKHPKSVPKVIKMMPRRGAGPPFWASLVPCGPTVSPRSTFGGFCGSFGRSF